MDDFKKINDEELEAAAGGGLVNDLGQWLQADKNYKSGSIPKYAGGQLVWIYNAAGVREYYTIADVADDKSGLINKEFVYTLRHEDGRTLEHVYESRIHAVYL